jgi:hypothetical protein
MAIGLPIKQLIGFGDIQFAGNTPLSPASESEPIDYEPKVTRPLASVPGQLHPYDILGYTAAPLDPATVSTWYYTLSAPDNSTDPLADLQSQIMTLYTKWIGTHTHRGTAGCTGQRGDLIVLGGDNNYYLAEAILTSVPHKFVAGETFTNIRIPLAFILLEEFAATSKPSYMP